jgi:hypothetical protein
MKIMIKFSLSLIALTLSVVLTAQTKIVPTLEVRRILTEEFRSSPKAD